MCVISTRSSLSAQTALQPELLHRGLHKLHNVVVQIFLDCIKICFPVMCQRGMCSVRGSEYRPTVYKAGLCDLCKNHRSYVMLWMERRAGGSLTLRIMGNNKLSNVHGVQKLASSISSIYLHYISRGFILTTEGEFNTTRISEHSSTFQPNSDNQVKKTGSKDKTIAAARRI